MKYEILVSPQFAYLLIFGTCHRDRHGCGWLSPVSGQGTSILGLLSSKKEAEMQFTKYIESRLSS